MQTLFSQPGGRYSVVDNGCPGLKIYDTVLEMVALGNSGYYDRDERTALEIATEDCQQFNMEGKALWPN